MTILSSRQDGPEPLSGPSDVARLVSASGVVVHIVNDRSSDPAELKIIVESADGIEWRELFNTTTVMSLQDVMSVIRKLGYDVDYQQIV